MVKPGWGTKRICQSCGARFYDLQRDPIICPKCSAVHDPEAILKTRRGRSVAVAEKVAAKPVAGKEPEAEAEELEVEASDDDLVIEEESEEDEDLIEDASELGEDNDDMAEVIENVDEEEER